MKTLILVCIIGATVAVVPDQLVEKKLKEVVVSDTSAPNQLGGFLNLEARLDQKLETQEKPDHTHVGVPTSSHQVTEKPEAPHQTFNYPPFFTNPYYTSSFNNFPYCNSYFPQYTYPPYHPEFLKFPHPNAPYPFSDNFNKGFFVPRTPYPVNQYHPDFYPLFPSHQPTQTYTPTHA